MPTLKLTVWNIEHFRRVLPEPPPSARPKFTGIVEEIREIDPDVLCILEGPGNILHMREFVDAADGLDGRYRLIELDGTDAALAALPDNPRKAIQKLYGFKGNDLSGNQWIWFLVRNDLAMNADAHLLDPEIWREMAGGPSWQVNFWGDFKTVRHSHWRQPQVLVMTLAGKRVEFIGVHLKSKINRKSPFKPGTDEISDDYVVEALRARVKLATEATDVRRYIEARFAQEPDPAIFVLGDANDGPGKELFEQRYLFFDLISTLQGEVFFARRFLNHALFDFDDRLRWSVRFKDRVDPERKPEMLIDHILFTQALVQDGVVPRIEAHAGRVEHGIHERINAVRTKKNRTSDHRPVTVDITF